MQAARGPMALRLTGVCGWRAEATRAQLPRLPLGSLVMLGTVLTETHSTPLYTKKGLI